MTRVKIKRHTKASKQAMLGGTGRRKPSRFPSMAAGPVRIQGRRAGIG